MPFPGRRTAIHIVSILTCLSSCLPVHAQTTMADAEKAWGNFDLSTCRTICHQLIRNPATTPETRVQAWQKLYTLDWKTNRNYRAALADLDAAIRIGSHRSSSLSLRSGLELENNASGTAISVAEQALASASGEEEQATAALAYAEAILKDNLIRYQNRQPIRIESVKRAAGLLQASLRKAPGRSQPSKVLSGLALLEGDGPLLLSALKGYYFIRNEEDIHTPLINPFHTLNQLLPNWKSRELSITESSGLMQALAGAGFYLYAAAIARHYQLINLSEKEQAKPILAFAEFITGIDTVNRRFYSAIARGKKKYEDEYDSAINIPGRRLWAILGMPPEKFTQDDFFNLIRNRYGAEGYVGNTVNYYSLLMGLTVWDENKEIDQYGYKARFRYISVDHLFSRDFTSWYGITNVGGWGTDSSIIQVRDAYLSEPFTKLSWMIDPAAKEKIRAQIAEARERDLKKCTLDRYAEPASLALAIKYHAAEQLFDSLKRAGLSDEALATAFIGESLRLNVESTIFAHEGRHAIDQLFFKKEFDTLPHDERELRAKFSEVLFTTNSKLAFTGSIFGSDLSEDTGHGKANKRFRKIIVDWMDAHKTEIPNLNPTVPLIMQFELLSDQQIRTLVQQADPLAHQKPSPQKN